MMWFSVGLPGRFSMWCDGVVARLAELAAGAVEPIAVDTLEDLALARIRARAPHIVAMCREPAGRLRSALVAAPGRVVVALDDPRLCVPDLVPAPEETVPEGALPENALPENALPDATRAVANSCAAVLGLLDRGPLVVRAEEAGAAPVATAAAIARHLALAVHEEDIAAIVGELAEAGLTLEHTRAEAWWGTADERMRGLVHGALGAYAAQFAGGEFGAIDWEPDLFAIGEEPPVAPAQAATRPIDITGRPRALIHGPHISLPAGSWSARLTLGVSQEASELTFIADVYAGTVLGQARIEPRRNGVVEADIKFAIDELFEGRIEIRVMNERAAFDGRIALGHVRLTRDAG